MNFNRCTRGFVWDFEGSLRSHQDSPWNFYGNVGNPLETFKISHKCFRTVGCIINPFFLQTQNFHPLEVWFQTAQTILCTVGWGYVNGWLGCSLHTTTHPPFTIPQWYGWWRWWSFSILNYVYIYTYTHIYTYTTRFTGLGYIVYDRKTHSPHA